MRVATCTDLDTVLETVELICHVSTMSCQRSTPRQPFLRNPIGVRAAQRGLGQNSPPSTSLRSGNRPGRLHA